jgi:hypothetical protein
MTGQRLFEQVGIYFFVAGSIVTGIAGDHALSIALIAFALSLRNTLAIQDGRRKP